MHGWSNYPTWAVNRWFGNDDVIRDLVTQSSSISDLAQRLEESILDIAPLEEMSLSGIWEDLFRHTLREINWRELATVYWADRAEDNEDEGGDGDSQLP